MEFVPLHGTVSTVKEDRGFGFIEVEGALLRCCRRGRSKTSTVEYHAPRGRSLATGHGRTSRLLRSRLLGTIPWIAPSIAPAVLSSQVKGLSSVVHPSSNWRRVERGGSDGPFDRGSFETPGLDAASRLDRPKS